MPADLRVLHLLDADAAPDPLFLAVAGEGDLVLRRQLRHPLLAWRAAGEVRAAARQVDAVAAWGDRAGELAHRAAVTACLYRPTADRWSPLLPFGATRAVCSSQTEREHLIRLGWPATSCPVIYPPVAPPAAVVSRGDLRLAESDFVWLLDASTAPTAGLREAAWAGALMHVMERDRRRHRLLICEQGPTHQRVLMFIDQLGLPELAVASRKAAFEDLAPLADALLITPTGPCPPWAPCLAAVSGLPTVATPRPEVREVLQHRSHVRFTPEDRTRVIVREMLQLSENLPARGSGDPRYGVDVARRQWRRLLLGGSVTGGSEREMSPAHR